nr:hypothetical protein [Tanacetum cinerariifolium]
MSSPNHPTSNIEDAFSSNFPNYLLASSDYFPASPGNTSSENSRDDIIPPVFSPFYNNLYMKDELLPLKKQTCLSSPSSTKLSKPYRNQAYNLVSPSLSVYTPTPPQIFELGKSSIKMHLKHHEMQVEDILNYLEEFSYHRIEKMEERLVNDIDFDERKTELGNVRSQIFELQKKHLGQRDKIDFARFRISNLE